MVNGAGRVLGQWKQGEALGQWGLLKLFVKSIRAEVVVLLSQGITQSIRQPGKAQVKPLVI